MSSHSRRPFPRAYLKRALRGAAAGVLVAVALASCSGNPEGAADKSAAVTTAPEPPLPEAPARVRVLTQDQYFNSLVYLFGSDARTDSRFPPFRRKD